MQSNNCDAHQSCSKTVFSKGNATTTDGMQTCPACLVKVRAMHNSKALLRLGVGICHFLQLLLAFLIGHQLPILHKPDRLVHLHVGLPICRQPSHNISKLGWCGQMCFTRIRLLLQLLTHLVQPEDCKPCKVAHMKVTPSDPLFVSSMQKPLLGRTG